MALLEGRALFTSVTGLTCLGCLLIGYDNGLMGGLVSTESFTKTFDSPGSTMIGLIVAIYQVGCFLGGVTTAFIGESIGRKKSIAIGAIIILIGVLLQSTAYSRAHMIVARVITGIGVGFIISTIAVFQAEFTPKATRGLYACILLTTSNFGTFLSYWIDYGFTQAYTASFAWRVPTIMQCIFLLPMFLILLVVPETPRWLAAHDKPEESLAVLKRLYGKRVDEDTILRLHGDILRTCETERAIGAGRWSDLLKNDNIQSQRRFLIACGILAFQQLGGINALVYYAPRIFLSIGMSPRLSALMSGFLQTWFFVASFIPWFLIDHVGRRPLFLSMVSVMAAIMVVQAGLVYNVEHKTSIWKNCSIAAAAMLFVYECAFAIGLQAAACVYPPEILPLRLRHRGTSVSAACNYILSYMITQITPPALKNIGYRTYIIFAVFNTSFIPIIYFFFPETKGLELEDVDKLFARGDPRLTLQTMVTTVGSEGTEASEKSTHIQSIHALNRASSFHSCV